MNKPTLTGTKKYHQGKYRPINPQKYIGNPCNIIYRSGWEKIFLKWCDITSSVISYGSEELVIPYISPIDNKIHRYYIDFFIIVRQSDGTVKKFAIEIKPYNQTIPPKITKKMMTESIKYKLETYSINTAKWNAARKFCKQHNMDFVILTERNLLKGKKK